MLTAAGLSVVLPMLIVAAAGDPEPPGCAVTDSHGRCLVIAVDPGRPGRPAAPDRDEPAGASDTRGDAPGADSAAPPARERPRLQAVPFGDGGWIQQVAPNPADFLGPLPAGAGQAADPVAVAQALSQRAIEELLLDPPVPHTSVIGAGYVGVPVWLWIEDGIASTGPVSATATAGAARVTATGRLSAVEWSMGPRAPTCAARGREHRGPGRPGPHRTAATPTNSARCRNGPEASAAGRSSPPVCGP